MLFGVEFAKKGKDMMDVRAMRSMVPKKSERKPLFFSRCPAHRLGASIRGMGEAEARTLSTEVGLTRREANSRTVKGQNIVNCFCMYTQSQKRNLPKCVDKQHGMPGHSPAQSNQLPAGRLKGYINAWKEITKDHWVLKTTKGYQIDFLSEPQQSVIPHTPQCSVE